MKKIMKVINGNIALLTCSCVLLIIMGCYKEPAIPAAPSTKIKPNITIKALKDSLEGTSLEITDNWIISGVVNSNDKSGNFHKQINIQDETGGINIQIESGGLYAKFAVGQEIIVKCKGLWLYNYNGTIQLCGSVEGSTSVRIPELYLPDRFFLNGYPNPEKIPIKVLTLDRPENDNYLSMLVEIRDVQFVKAVRGLTWATPSAAASREFVDQDGSSAIVRTSNFADFAAGIIPSDEGTLRGVWSAFGSDRQLFFRDLGDVMGFKEYETPLTSIFEESFASSLGDFKTWNELGSNAWKYDSKYGAVAKGSNACKSWLISPTIDLAGYSVATINFDHAINFAGTNKLTFHTLWITIDDGTNYADYEWTQVPIVNYPSVNGWTFVSSGAVKIPAEFIGKSVKFAFKYQSASGEVSTWEVKNVKVGAAK